jgi:APA family basic amino acid/polyamine antiporter
MYGWTLLLVSQSGGMAAAAVTFAGYVSPSPVWQRVLSVAAIAVFTAINALGVRQGASTQNLFMLLKIAAIGGFVVVGLFVPHAAGGTGDAAAFAGGSALAAMGLAMVPVLFAYSGWQTSSFMSAELKEPAKTLPRGLIAGVVAVVVLYLAVNLVSLHALGIHGLAATDAPASDIAALALGPVGRNVMIAIVALSTLGFLSNQILTSPRVYFQMAADGTFFRFLARVNAKTHAPVMAIVLQGTVAIVIALIGLYDWILNYVTSVDYVFFGLSALALIIFRNRDQRDPVAPKPGFTMPGHPWTTGLFLVIAWAIVADVMVSDPKTAWGLGILATGYPVYLIFAHYRAKATERSQSPGRK